MSVDPDGTTYYGLSNLGLQILAQVYLNTEDKYSIYSPRDHLNLCNIQVTEWSSTNLTHCQNHLNFADLHVYSGNG